MTFGAVFPRAMRPAFGPGLAAAAAAGNWWEAGGATGCVAAYQPKGAASLAASYVNLANPGTYDAAPGTAPTFDSATGWTFDGATQYLTTGYGPSSGATWAAVVRFSNVTNSSVRVPLGATSSGSYYAVIPRNFGATVQYGSGSGVANGATARSLVGVMAVSGANGYFNGVLDTASISLGASSLGALFIGAANNGGSPANIYGGNIEAIAIYNTAITGPQVAAVSAAIAAL